MRAGIPVLALLILLAPVAAAETVQLQWKDTGYDVYPGIKVGISLSAEFGSSWGGLSDKWAEAYAEVGPWKFEINGQEDFWGKIHMYLRIYENGELVHEEELASSGILGGGGTAEAYIIIDMPCSGSGKVIYNGEVLGSIPSQKYDIFKNEVDEGDLKASVKVETIETYSCGGSGGSGGSGSSGGGNPPPPSGSTVVSGLYDTISKAANAFLIPVALGAAAIVVMIIYSQSKRRGWVR